MKTIISLLFVLIIGFSANAQLDFIAAKDAAKLMNDDNTIFVSMRTPTDYQKVHVVGAVNIDHKDLYGEMSMLKSPTDIAKILGQKGLAANKNIILYDDGSGKYAGRMYWILDYMGATNVQIIDGGMKGWRLARKPVTKNPSQITPATFTPNINKAVYADMASVKQALNQSNYMVVDARSEAEFAGTASTNLRPGRIPGAVNFDFQQVLTPQGMIKPVGELTSLFENAGISKAKSIILYCESSVRAGILYATLKGLGYTKVSVYDGAYLEWQASPANKVL
ncbi:MAG: sulfurtransferase [Cyclobacteriaceae bacterium]